MRRVLARHRERPRAHPRETSFSVITIVAGAIAFFSGIVHDAHFVALCVGIAAFFFGLYSQMVSVTTAERWINVIGIGLAFVGAGLGIAHGGFRL